jgi:WD40 repeat protein/transcriptional regulator with XRE-family HTH domain
MSRSLKLRSDCIEKTKLALKFKGFRSQRDLAEDCGLALSTVNKFLTGKSVDYATFVEICERLGLECKTIADVGEILLDETLKEIPETVKTNFHQDWGEAIDVSIFYNRAAEIATLEQWIVGDRCRLVTLFGMGGIGKTALSVKLAEQIQDQFDYLIWRSLRNAPPIQTLLTNLLQFLSDEQETELPETFDEQLSRLITYLRASRCLLILDNAESILQSGESPSDTLRDRAGCYRAGYEEYGQLLKCVGETFHNSCLVLTSRELPKELVSLAGKTLPVRCLKLEGLSSADGRKLFQIKGDFTGSNIQWSVLIDRYAGNPLALKIVASAIEDFFEGNISSFLQFLEQDSFIFDELRDLLQQQFQRLTHLEREIMYWLAINREPLSMQELQADVVNSISPGELLGAIASLQRRSLIEKSSARFTQQPVVMEYAIGEFIDRIVTEIAQQKLNLFKSHALVKATAKDYIRDTQIRLILQTAIDKLLAVLGSSSRIENCLTQCLSMLRGKPHQEIGYAGGNILNLLRQLQVDLSGYDFSHLAVWQANLEGMNLRDVNFAYSDLKRSVFSEMLDEVWSVALSQDGQLLATGDNDCKIGLWQIQTGQQILTCRGHGNWVRSVAFSQDSQTLVSGSADRTVKLWSVIRGECLKTFSGHHDEVSSVAISPDGQIVISGSSDETVKLWDVNTGECLKTFAGHSKGIFAIAVSNDGKIVASGSGDRTIKLWDIQTGQCLNTCTGHQDWVLSMAFSPDGRTLFSSSPDRTVKQWDVSTGQCIKTYRGHQNWVLSVAVSSDGQSLISSSGDKTIKRWNVSTGQCIKTFVGNDRAVWSVAWGNDGKIFASSSSDQTVKLWDIETGQCFKTFAGYTNRVYSVAWSSNGKTIASGNFDSLLRVWDVETIQCCKTLSGHTKQIFAVAFSPDGQTIASGSGDRTIKLWDLKTGQCLKTFIGHEDWIYTVAFSSNGQILASGGGDHTIALWSITTGECLKTLTGHKTWIWSVAFSPDGRVLASSSGDRTIRLWDTSTGECLKTLTGHSNRVYAVAFSPDGQILASGSFDRSIKLWNLNSGECLQTLTEHRNGVYAVAFSPDGQTIASGSLDQTIKLWNINSDRCIVTFVGHTNEIRSVAFNKDGKTLVSGSQDRTVRIWDVRTGECLKILRAIRLYEGMNLTGVTGLTGGQKTTLRRLGANYSPSSSDSNHEFLA